AIMANKPITDTGRRDVHPVEKRRHALVPQPSAERPHFVALGACKSNLFATCDCNSSRAWWRGGIKPSDQRRQRHLEGLRQNSEDLPLSSRRASWCSPCPRHLVSLQRALRRSG